MKRARIIHVSKTSSQPAVAGHDVDGQAASNGGRAGISGIVTDLFAFVAGLSIALYQGWETKDLVWSMWLGSLCVGYLSILSAIAAGLYIAMNIGRRRGSDERQAGRFILFAIGVAAFMLGFFSLHFCGFHAVHALFLSSFFPLESSSALRASPAFFNPLTLWSEVFRKVMPLYGVFLVVVLISERSRILEPLERARELVTGGRGDGRVPIDPKVGTKEIVDGRSYFMAPYANVIRLHILIFFFAAAHLARLPAYITFTVAYSVYFLPVRAFVEVLRGTGSGDDVLEGKE